MKWNSCCIVSVPLNTGKDLGIENSATVQLIALMLPKRVYWVLKTLEPLLQNCVLCYTNGIVSIARNTTDHPVDYKSF